jgi:hypothetical protein
MGAVKNLSRMVLVLCLGSLAFAVTAHSTPLGLQVGDVIETIEFDALEANSLGGNYTAATGELVTEGQITSVLVDRGGSPTPILQSGVSFNFAVELADGNIFPGGNLLTTWVSSSLTDPDVTIKQNGNIILTGDFMGNFFFGGFLNQATLTAVGNILVTGGDPNLVNALGTSPSVRILLESASVFGFDPSLTNLLADNIAGNENFYVQFDGTLRAVNAVGFVPEPSTVLMLAAGLLGLIAMGRRRIS